jgi:hypothetical protein
MFPSEFGRLCRAFSVGVKLVQWEMPEDEPELVAEMLAQPIYDGVCGTAGRTFVVAVFDKRRVASSFPAI